MRCIGILLVILFNVVGCVKTTGSLNEFDPSSISFEGIQFKAKRYSVYVNNQLTIPQSDISGKAPFVFKIDQGIGTIDASTGLFTAPDVLGFAVISIKDSEGRLGYISVEVVDDLRVKSVDFSMVAGTSYLLQVSGGKYPYTFVVQKGDVTVDSLGVIKAGATSGPATVKVLDSSGNSREVNLNVVKNITFTPEQFSVTLNGTKDFVLTGGVGLTQLSLSSGVGSVTTTPARFTAGTTTGTAVVAGTDEMGNVGYAYGQVFGSLQISPHIMKIPKGQSFNHFEALGGVPPFTFSIQGSGIIDATTGQYTAPANTGTDTVTVTDSLGHTSQATITITNADRFIVKNAIVQLGETLDYSSLIDGGSDPYVFGVNPGEGSFSAKIYTPPATTGNYLITVTENGGQSTQSIVLVYPSLKLNPTSLNISVDSLGFFSAQGGVPPYTFSVISGPGTIDAQTGVYNSGAQLGNAVVQVTDAKNHTATSTVQILARLDLTADKQNIEVGGTVNFTASGGLSPYTFSIASGSGSIDVNGANGAILTAGLNAGIVQVDVKDSIGNRVSKYVQVLSKLSTTPQALNLKVNQQYNFGAQGGMSPYVFSLVSGTGTITAEGLYKASSKATTDKIKVTDSLGNSSESTIVVYENMQMLPQSKTILTGESLQLSVSGGIPPITYSLSSGQGTVNQQGLFTASATAGNVVIHASDKEGNFADSVVVVNPPLEILPTTVTVKTNKNYNFAAAGGIPPYKFSIPSANGGTINSATGEYTAPNSSGDYQVQVQDGVGNIVYATVKVNNGNGNNNNLPPSGAADHLLLLAGDAQTGTVQTILPNSFQVKVLDSSGNAVSGASLKVTRISGSGTPGFTTLTTDVNGIASTPYFLGTAAGTETIRIESSGTAFPGSPALINFTATAIPAAPSALTSTLIASPNSNIPADDSSTASLTVTVKDIYGNVIPNASINLNVSGSGNTLNLNSTTTDSSGQVTGTLKSSVAENKTLTFVSPAELAGLNTVVGFGATVTPDSTMSSIIGAATTVADGVSEASISITLKNSSGVGASGYVPTFSATDTNGANTYGACSMSDGNGNSTCTLKSTKAETKNLTLLTPVNKTGIAITFTHGPPNRIVFVQQPVTAFINSALSPQPIVEVQDAYGNTVTTGTESTSSVTLSLTSGTGAMSGTANMNAANGVADFTGKSIAFDRAGPKLIKASLGTYVVNSNVFNISSTPTLLTWSGSTSFSRAVCGALSVSTYDNSGDLTNVSSAVNVTLGGNGSGAFYSDSNCATPIVSTTIDSGTNSKIVYFKSSTSGAYNLTADATGLTQGIYNISVIPGAPTALAWSGTNFTAAGSCSAALTVTTVDTSTQAAVVTENTVVALGGQGNGSFYSDNTCDTSITDVTIPSGASSATVYFKDLVGEVLMLTADKTGFVQGVFVFQSRYPILYLSGTGPSTLDGDEITSCGAHLNCNSSNPFNPYIVTTVSNSTPRAVPNYYRLTMENAAVMTANGTTDSSSGPNMGKLIITVTENLTLCSSCVVTMDTKGYPINTGPGAGVAYDGGSYGGKGGRGTFGVGGGTRPEVDGSEYGSIKQPTELGSGGSGGYGTGGGHISMTVGGTLYLDGTITAKGNDGVGTCCYSGSGAGSGGSVYINANTLSGSTGIIRASGGNGTYNGMWGEGGGGGGGRIAIHYNNSPSNTIAALTLEAFGGKRGNGAPGAFAGAGTIFYKHQGVDSVGHLIVKNDPNFPVVYDGYLPPSTQLLADALTEPFDSFTASANSVISLKSGTFNLPTAGVLNFPVFLNGGSLGNIPNNDLTIASDGILFVPGNGVTTFNNLTVNGKLYQGNINTNVLTYSLKLNVLNNLTVGPTGIIDGSYHGYASGGAGYGGAGYKGGGHGGVGGYNSALGSGGPVHDSVIDPNDAGGAGWQTTGFGGGLVDITVGNVLDLSGTIKSNGAACSFGGCGAGAGGTVKINTGTLAGSGGAVYANGGNGDGAGGGGRIALLYSNITYSGGIAGLAKQAYGGDGSGTAGDGGVGTIFYKQIGTDSVGHLIIAGNGPALSYGNSNFPTSELTGDGLTTVFDSITVPGNTILEIKSGSLNLPNGVLDFPLYLNGGSLNVPNNDLTISSNGILFLSGTGSQTFNNLEVNGKIYQWNFNGTTAQYKTVLNVTNDLTLNSSGEINVTGRGYYNGGPGYLLYWGGSHGGKGGGLNSGGAAGYDSIMNPTDLGGAGYGGENRGGGAIDITVGGIFNLSGKIIANAGVHWGNDKGGAGGSIKLTMGTLAGDNGLVQANGQSTNYGGGGGRIAIYYNSDTYNGTISNLAKQAYGGSGNSAMNNGAAGTIFYKRVGVDSVGHLIVKNNPSFTLGNPNPSTTDLFAEGQNAGFDSITIGSNTVIEASSGTLNLPTSGALDFPLYLNGATIGNIPGNDLTINSTGILWLSGTSPLTVNNLTVEGSIYQMNYNSSSLLYQVVLNVLNDFDFRSGAVIDVSNRGYFAGGPGYGIYCGGSHGGKGGGLCTSGGLTTFDSIMNPADLGGAGASGENRGGGLVDITVGNIFTLNGTVRANGSYWGSDRGGAGGSIKITTNTLAGSTGMLQANGQNAGYGGGGGRIAIYYNNDTYGISSLNKEAYGGSAWNGANNVGGAGTIFYKHVGVDTVGHLIIKNNPGFTVQNPSYSTTDLLAEGQNAGFDSITVDGSAVIEVSGGTFNLPTAGVVDFPVVLSGGSLGNMPGNDLTIASNGTLWVPGNGTVTFNNLTVNGKLYQSNYNGTTLQYKMVLDILNNLNLASGGVIDVSNRGYYNGGASFGKNYGGSHGGKGGSTLASPWMYDSVTNPADLGGAGYSSENRGGGLVDISVANTFTLNGIINANAGVNWGSDRGGAGGSINITTNILNGSTGSLTANGQASSHAGGGGRIAIHYSTDNYTGGVAALSKQANGAISGYGASYSGGIGTIYVSPKLDLNFATGILPGVVNFTRASSGTYYDSSGVLTTAGINQPRFDYDPSNNNVLGLLIEPQRTNVLSYSEDISQAVWNKLNASVSSSSLAPDGVTVPFKLEESTINGYHAVSADVSLTANQDYVLSFYAKAVERSWLSISTIDMSGAGLESFVNLATGSNGTIQHNKVVVQNINNGWNRVFVTFNAQAGISTPNIAIGTATADLSSTYAGTAGNGFYVWGVQLEQGSFGTSYIKTAGGSATRNADVATVTDLSWFIGGANSLGSFVLDVQVPFVSYGMPFMQMDDGSSATEHFIGINSSSATTRYLMKESASTLQDLTNGSWSDSDRKKICASFKVGSGVLSSGGVTATTAAPTSVPTSALTTLRIGADATATSFSGHIIRLQYSRDNFSNETCSQLSQ